MEFSRQEYWSEEPFPTPEALSNPGMKPGLLHCRQILYHLSHQGSPWMWELDHKEDWAPKNWCFLIVQKTLESPLDRKEIKPVNPKENQPWIFIGRTDAEAEAPILWLADVKSWLIGKDPNAGKDWGQEEKGVTEDEMAGQHYWLNGHKFEYTQGDTEGQGSLACCSPWGPKELDMI